MPNPDSEIIHDHTEIVQQVHGTQQDLTDIPWPDPDFTYFTDSNSFVWEGTR